MQFGARRAGGLKDSSPLGPLIFERSTTATITPAPQPTDFDWALFAAVAAGWEGRPAFDAVCCMLASGMTESQIERAFNDARTRVQ